MSDEVTGIDATSPSRNGHGSDTWCQPWRHLRIEHSGAGHCRVTFDHPPSNAVTATTLAELDELLGLIEQDPDLKVVVFASANPDVFLAHGEEEQPASMAAWRDLLARLSRARVVTIAALRGGVHDAGSEFAMACDLQFRLRD